MFVKKEAFLRVIFIQIAEINSKQLSTFSVDICSLLVLLVTNSLLVYFEQVSPPVVYKLCYIIHSLICFSGAIHRS